MMAAVQHGLYPDMQACAAEWVEPRIGSATRPDATLAALFDKTFPLYVEARNALRPLWRSHKVIRQEALHAS
jgi:erythritol kinase